MSQIRLMKPDIGFDEEEAEFRNRHGSTKHQPALPL